MSKHTPLSSELPWTVAGDSPATPPMIWDAKGDAILSAMTVNGLSYFEPDVAEFIVRACNAHEALVEALERCNEWLCTGEAQKSEYHLATERMVSKALARARGER